MVGKVHVTDKKFGGKGQRVDGELATSRFAIHQRTKSSIQIIESETFAGKSSNGNWLVQIDDTALQDDGELFCIELIITSTNPVESIPLVPLSSGSVDWAMYGKLSGGIQSIP